jgi:hypothetical protein
MGSHEPDIQAVVSSIPGRTIPKNVKLACIVGIVIGIVTAGYGFTAGGDITHEAQGAFLINWIYFHGIAQGGFMMAVIGMCCYARWQKRFKRITEAFAIYLPISYVILLIFLALGGINVYPWHVEDMSHTHHKEIYFGTGFFWARQILCIGFLVALSLWFVKKSIRSDLGVAKGMLERANQPVPTGWGRFIANWTDDNTEIEAAQKSMINISPLICVSYALLYGMMSVDLSMSLAPHFYTNMFPAWFSMSSIWSGLVWTAIFSITCTKWLGLGDSVGKPAYHDIGKLTFAFCMFWGYTTFAQYLPIWYGNMTEEIGFILIRTHGEVFAKVTALTFVLCFVAPWTILLSRGIKKIPKAYLSVCILIAIGIWFERYTTNMPSVHNYHFDKAPLPLGFIEFGMLAGFLGLFVLVVMWFLHDKPGMVISDPRVGPDPEHVHVHAHHH